MGASVGYPAYFEQKNNLWRWEDPGIRMLAQDNPGKEVDISVPEHSHGKNVYYKCSPGKKYMTEIKFNSPSGGQKVKMLVELRDSEGNSLTQVGSGIITVDAGRNTYSREFYVPHLPETDNIYYDSQSDITLQITAKAKVSNLFEEVVVSKFALYHGDLPAQESPRIKFAGEEHLMHGKFDDGKVISLGICENKDARAIVECNAGGTGRLSWLMRQENIDWQVRNAAVSDHGQYLQIDSLRSPWTPEKEVVIAPFGDAGQPFVHKTRNINKCKIFPLNRGNDLLKIDVQNFDTGAAVKIVCPAAPSAVNGSDDWNYNSGILTVNVQSVRPITAEWI